MISKLPEVGTSIFAVMTGLAQKYDAINLAQGFPNFEPPQDLITLVHDAMVSGHNQYAPMPGWLPLRQVISHKIARSYGYEPNPDTEITITAGATQGLFCAIQALVHPGDEVIVLEPAYDSYVPAIRLAGGIPIPYALQAPDFQPDWDKIQGLITSKTRVIIVNNPHNPTGRLLSKVDMAALKRLVLENDLYLISDEVYEHLIFDGQTHHSVLADPELFQRSMVTFSFGKTFHATGWKLGYIVCPEALTKAFRLIHQFNVFSVFTPGQVALAKYMQNPEVWEGLGAFYQSKRDFFYEAIQASGFKPLPCEGTYFGLLDYSGLSVEDDLTFCRNYAERCGVAFIPISPFYSIKPEGQHIVRVCFAKTIPLLSQAAKAMVTANY